MVVHSEMAKKIGIAAAIFGIALIIISAVLLVPTQDATVVIPVWGEILFAVFLGYSITVGVYFTMMGVFIWLIGAGIEWRALKQTEDAETEDAETAPWEVKQ